VIPVARSITVALTVLLLLNPSHSVLVEQLRLCPFNEKKSPNN
jgi:hypothetical protein